MLEGADNAGGSDAIAVATDTFQPETQQRSILQSLPTQPKGREELDTIETC